MKNKKYLQSTKEIQPLIKAEVQKTQTWTKIKQTIFFVSFSILLGTLFYSYVFIEPFSQEYHDTKKVFDNAKKRNTSALNEIKKSVKGTNVYDNYKLAYKSKKTAYTDFVAAINDQKVNGFDSIHFFWERFGKNTTAFLFCLWVLYLTIRSADKLNKWIFYGRVIIIGVFMSTIFFTYFWIFQRFQDFSKPVYYLMTLATSYFVFLAMYVLFRSTKTKEEKLRSNMLEIAKFTFKNTKPEKREEMLDMIKKIAKDN